MFDAGFTELLLVLVIGLLVLGPERLPKVARTAGMYLRRARQTWSSVKTDIERELAADELKKSMLNPTDLKQPFEDLAEDLSKPISLDQPSDKS